MTRTEWVIKVLTDAYNTNLSPKNEDWLRKNVEALDIRVCVEDSVANTFDIAEECFKHNPKSQIIQDGKRLIFRGDFNPFKEALLIEPRQSKPTYFVYLYSPKQFEEKN